MASTVSKTAFVLETTITIAKSYLGLFRSMEGALQTIFDNINATDTSWNTQINNTTDTYYSLVNESLESTNLLVGFLQSYLSNQTTPQNEYVYRVPVVSQLSQTNDILEKILDFWQDILPLSASEDDSTNEGKLQNFRLEAQKKHYQNVLAFGTSIQITLTTITVLFGTVDKAPDTFISNLHVILFENFIDNAYQLYSHVIESSDELQILIDNQEIKGQLITNFTSKTYISCLDLVIESFEAFRTSTEDIFNELSK
jgi:hypothetical protein